MLNRSMIREFGCQPPAFVSDGSTGRRKWSAKESRATLEKWKDEKSIEAWNRPGKFDIDVSHGTI